MAKNKTKVKSLRTEKRLISGQSDFFFIVGILLMGASIWFSNISLASKIFLTGIFSLAFSFLLYLVYEKAPEDKK